MTAQSSTRHSRVQIVACAAFATVALGGTFLAGCGSGSGTLPVANGSGSTSSGSNLGRVFSAGNLSLGDNRRGALTVRLNASRQAEGTLTLVVAGVSGTVTLTGTGNPATGQFNLAGSGTINGQAMAVAVSGTLPGNGATTGGSVDVTLNGTAYPATTFNGSTSTGTGTGTGGGTTNPVPTPTGSPSPTPTPTPTATASPGSGTLARYFSTSHMAATLTYRDTTTTTSTNFVTGQPETATNTTQYTTQAGDDVFASNATGNKTTVTLATAQGNVSVTRQELLDDQERVIGYTYFTQDSSAYTLYGSDILNAAGQTISRSRYSPAVRYALDLRVGQSATITTQVTTTTIEPATNETSDQTFSQTFKLTFVGVESVTTPAGTFADVARVRNEFSFSSSTFSLTTAIEGLYAPNIGEVKSHTDSRSVFPFTNPGTGETQNFETHSISETELIALEANR